MTNSGTNRRRPRRHLMGAAMLAGAVTALGALLWTGTPAHAVASPTLAESSSASNSDTRKSATATCPGNLRVYGAAFNIVDGGGKVAVNTLEPSSDLRTVFVEAQETQAFGGNWRLDAQAICGPAVANLHRVAVTKAPAVHERENARAGCPVGEKIYGGGYTFAGGRGEVLLTLVEYFSVREVLVAGQVDDNAALSWGITAYGICGAPAATHVARTITDQVFDSNTPKDETVFCPNGTHVHGVGVRLTGAAGDVVVEDLTVTAALTSLRAKAFENDSTAANWSVRPQVICAS